MREEVEGGGDDERWTMVVITSEGSRNLVIIFVVVVVGVSGGGGGGGGGGQAPPECGLFGLEPPDLSFSFLDTRSELGSLRPLCLLLLFSSGIDAFALGD